MKELGGGDGGTEGGGLNEKDDNDKSAKINLQSTLVVPGWEVTVSRQYLGAVA